MPTRAVDLSIVVPAFNEADNLPLLVQELEEVLVPMALRWELVLVDDGSKDATFSVIRQLAGKDGRIRGLRFSRNFGHQIALTAGLAHSRGRAVVMMDADLQHPPPVIPLLWKKFAEEGYDVVNTRREDAQSTGWFKRASSRFFYGLMNRLSEVELPPSGADFRLLSRRAVDALLQLPEKDRFTRGLVAWIGFRQTQVPYTARPRNAGKTSYSVWKMAAFALDGITSFSSRPLRLPFIIGLVFCLGALVYGVYAVVRLFQEATVPGWTSLLIVLLLVGGLNLIFLAIIGEYIGRIFREAKGRPLYYIMEDTAQPATEAPVRGSMGEDNQNASP